MAPHVLVVGGMGFVGHALVARLCRRSVPVELTVADLDRPRLLEGADPLSARIASLRRERVAKAASTVVVDVRDADAVSRAVRDVRPDVVVHLAAVSVADDAERHPELAIDTNVQGLKHVLEAARGRGIRFVFASSSFVYGNFEAPTVDEGHPLRPRGVYGATKCEGERLVAAAHASGGVEAVIIRPSAVYGPYDSNQRIVQKLLEEARAGRASTLRGAEHRLDFTYGDDLAAGMELAAFHPLAPGRVFNITRGDARSLRELSMILGSHFPGHVTMDRPADPSKPIRGSLSIGQARTTLGYQSSWSLESGIASYVDFYRELGEDESGLGGRAGDARGVPSG